MAIHTIANGFLSVGINTRGAELCSVVSTQHAIQYIWQADPAVWARHAPHLFPIVGKLKEGTYSYNKKNYQLPQHGFARDQEFTCIEASPEMLCFELTANEDSLTTFPFHFKLRISYVLQNTTLSIQYSVFNADTGHIWFSIGAHPAFNCPLQKHEAFEDYELQFPQKDHLILNTLNNGLITSATKQLTLHQNALPLSTSLFDTDAMVLKHTQVEQVKLISKKTGHGVSLTALGWPYFGIWTKPATTQFLCLEPWFGIADSDTASGQFEEKEGIMCLEPTASFSASFSMNFF